MLLDSLVSIANNDGGADMMNQSVDEFADYLKTHVIVEFTTERADEAAKLRDSLKGLLTRLKAEDAPVDLSLIHISEPTRRHHVSRMPSSA